MKKKLIILTFSIAASLFAYATLFSNSLNTLSMPYAVLIPDDCISCGNCIEEVGVPFFDEGRNTPWWGIYQTGEQWGLKYYHNPTVSHQENIVEGQDICPFGELCVYYQHFN
ncbi:MAG: hypothetical protein AB9922_07930 [Bacteroidales bacterium]